MCANELLRLTGYDYGYLKLSFYGKHHRAPFGAPNAVSIGMIKELSYALSSLELERYKIYAPSQWEVGAKIEMFTLIFEYFTSAPPSGRGRK